MGGESRLVKTGSLFTQSTRTVDETARPSVSGHGSKKRCFGKVRARQGGKPYGRGRALGQSEAGTARALSRHRRVRRQDQVDEVTTGKVVTYSVARSLSRSVAHPLTHSLASFGCLVGKTSKGWDGMGWDAPRRLDDDGDDDPRSTQHLHAHTAANGPSVCLGTGAVRSANDDDGYDGDDDDYQTTRLPDCQTARLPDYQNSEYSTEYIDCLELIP